MNSLQPTSFGLMQEEHLQEPYFLRAKLLEGVDADYKVKDMPLIVEVLRKLEVLHVSKEILEASHLGKTVNEFRRKVNDVILAKRLKKLVKKWMNAVFVNYPPQNRVHGTSPVSNVGHTGRGGKVMFPAFNSGYISASSSPRLVPASSSPMLLPASSSPRLVAAVSRVSPAGSNNSNCLSPRIRALTNYANNNSNNIPANRNGSSSISNRSPTDGNPHLSSDPYATLMSPPASTASPLLSSRNLISPYRSKSPGGTTLAAFNAINSNHSPLPSSHFQSSSSTDAPNAETVSGTNAASKRFRELDDSPLSASVEPPFKKSRSAANGTLDDPILALDEISRDSYASRGSDHSDGFTSTDNVFSLSAPSPTAAGETLPVLSPQMSALGSDSNVPSPTTPFDTETATTSEIETQPKKKRRRRQNESVQDSEAILREKIAQAQARKAAKPARKRKMRKNLDRKALLLTAQTQEPRRRVLEESVAENKLTGNVFVDEYLKSQNELQAKMERDAVLAGSDFQGAQEDTNEFNVSPNKMSKKEKENKHLLTGTAGATVNVNQFPSEAEILAKLPPIDPEILKEFENFQYDVTPSPVQPSHGGDMPNSYNNKETERTNNLKSLSTSEEKPRKLIDWGDSDDDDMDDQSKVTEQAAAADIFSPQTQVISESTVEHFEPLTTAVVISSAAVDDTDHPDDSVTSAAAHREVDDAQVEKYIKEQVPNLNGNYDREGQFREWHQTLTVQRSYKPEPLHILPYTIIDF